MNKTKAIKDFDELMEKLSADEFEIIYNYHKIMQAQVIENQRNGKVGEQLFQWIVEEEE